MTKFLLTLFLIIPFSLIFISYQKLSMGQVSFINSPDDFEQYSLGQTNPDSWTESDYYTSFNNTTRDVSYGISSITSHSGQYSYHEYIKSLNNITDHGRNGYLGLIRETAISTPLNSLYLDAWVKPIVLTSANYGATVGIIVAFQNVSGYWNSIYYTMAFLYYNNPVCYYDNGFFCPSTTITVNNTVGQWMHLRRELKTDFESSNLNLGPWSNIKAIKVIPAVAAADGTQAGESGSAEAYFDDISLSNCQLTSLQFLQLNGSTSGSNTVGKSETVSSNLTGNGCYYQSAQITDSNNNQKCTCTFSGNTCLNSACFVAPSAAGTYNYTGSVGNANISSQLKVSNFDIIYENLTGLTASWMLLPSLPSKSENMSLILNATDLFGNPLTPTSGFSPTIAIGTTSYRFDFLPSLFAGVPPLWMATFSSSNDNFIAIASNQPGAWKLDMRANITQGNDSLRNTNISWIGGILTISSSPSDPNTNYINYSVIWPSNFSVKNQGTLAFSNSIYGAQISPIDQQFILELLASSTSSYGGTYFFNGLQPATFSVTPSLGIIQMMLDKSFKRNYTLVNLTNTGNVPLNGIQITASSEIANQTTINPSSISLAVSETKTVNVSFDVYEFALSGILTINYSGGTLQNIPVKIRINDTDWVSISSVLANAAAGFPFQKGIPISNLRDVPIDIENINVLEAPNITGNLLQTVSVQGGGSAIFNISGTIFTQGNYSGWVQVVSSEGTKYAILSVSVLTPPSGLYDEILLLKSAVASLDSRMSSPTISDKITSEDNSSLASIYNLVNQANSSFLGGDFSNTTANVKSGENNYNDLEKRVTCYETGSGCGGGFSYIYIFAIAIVVSVVAIIFLDKELKNRAAIQKESHEKLPYV